MPTRGRTHWIPSVVSSTHTSWDLQGPLALSSHRENQGRNMFPSLPFVSSMRRRTSRVLQAPREASTQNVWTSSSCSRRAGHPSALHRTWITPRVLGGSTTSPLLARVLMVSRTIPRSMPCSTSSRPPARPRHSLANLPRERTNASARRVASRTLGALRAL
ncbi:hypothetical protein ATCV1_z110L [Acanthocystis turfacea chlorella virus 1]|uniref:Uncharacterized protein z110L n=1 Tax=Chlorovirus heliozoae TaxID=322019 RepID=A7K870_9PHYC|nr:hypothetical protein ATCV1_z110L [Acanthocystis turfacea chlorella virus 1]ABT16244.1 hypothetical protein ATCV1_z110L [Acanthocystis turfacea chlorella virus 1]